MAKKYCPPDTLVKCSIYEPYNVIHISVHYYSFHPWVLS